MARWQADGQSAEETRVVGAFGYLNLIAYAFIVVQDNGFVIIMLLI